MCLATKRMIACSCRTVQKTVQPTSSTKKFFKLFAQMKNCFAADQKRIIKEMSGLMKDMNEEEFTTVFSKELFDGTDRMMKNKILPFENATLLLKHIGYRKTLNKLWSNSFERSSLSKTLKEMIVAEEKKKEEKNEDLLANMCECYLYLLITYPPKLLPVCVPCLLKAAMRKEESEVVRRDVEAALLALSIIGNRINQEKDQCFDQISDIIRYHQRHSNLTPLGYQSAWEFLIDRFRKARELGNEIVKELKFIREAAREIEELMGFVDWKKENDVMETEEERIIERWMETVRTFIFHCKSVEHESGFHYSG
ncbi:uncharacterized protein MONOS_3352 [Monocercomonoides exilis]|uniref:uncharacterized protein n=1 Tax=Monocercomonoides exilis TaxID=2049356 RepID=UPI00355A46B3|nr:hypothetical protein MONOS_3352 [Monocercomonoides exilis]|eukprot:MONOS_3352.1-p1 / transcript=MONOS_3352.1 / gene=MONOS_3352 / organism=Monocercomonoides_exilis_PA203 / gene_product=unspecified product / transcript_product=unspecified product / location=Mono_scaffold00078:72683-73841(+) / protein_length=311 / sequence_SO=supercontig / SO=protein_coding / is_pseudo=false